MAVIQERKTSEGKTRFRVLVRLKGYPAQSATFDRKTDAKKWAQQTESAIREGRHFKTAEAKKHTLGEMIDRYLRDVLPHRKKGQQKQKSLLEWWKEALGPYALAEVTPALIAECRDQLLNGTTYRGTQRSPATVVRYMAALSVVFNLAVNEWEWLEVSPMAKVKKPKEPRGRVRFLDQEERERLLDACHKSRSRLLYPIVVLAISSGMRQGEILGLTWKDVDFIRRRVVLHETKNDERRAVPVTGLAHELLQELSKVRRIDSHLVFPGNNPEKPVDFRHDWEKALKEAKIEDFRFHDLRHTAASYLAMNGATLAEIAEVLGHKTLQMVKRYAHLSEAHTASVVDRMNEKIFG
jgi:integrase